MKIILVLLCTLMSQFINAEIVYQLNDDGNQITINGVNRQIFLNDENIFSYKEIDKKTYYPEKGYDKKWNAICSKDRFTGVKSCSISTYASDVFVYFAKGKYSVLIGRNHYPETSSAIKIDGNAPIYGYEGISKTPIKVIEQMKKGKVAYTRYQEWPYEYNKDNEVDLSGFAEALEQMKIDYANL